jgi:hypothetical protein
MLVVSQSKSECFGTRAAEDVTQLEAESLRAWEVGC